MQKNTYHIIMIMMKINNKIIKFILVLLVSSCSLAPGMYFNSDFKNNETEYVYLDKSKKISIPVQNINEEYVKNISPVTLSPYKIGVGDSLVVTVWGLPEIFPMNVSSSDINARTVNTDGSIFFPYVGKINVLDKSQTEVREELTDRLSEYFNDPQLDVSISNYNSQKIYILGEVTAPKKIFLTETPLSLSDALGESLGLRTDTSAANEVFVIRSSTTDINPSVFKADMSSPSSFIIAGEFFLVPGDVVYVNAKGTSRWNRVISQFFPFSSLLNSVDNLITD